MPLKPSFHISTLSLALSLDVVGIGGLLDLLKWEPEANVPGHQAEAGDIKTVESYFLTIPHILYLLHFLYILYILVVKNTL